MNKLIETIGKISLDKIDPEKEQITAEGKNLFDGLIIAFQIGDVTPTDWEETFVYSCRDFYDEYDKITPGQWKILKEMEGKYL